MKWKKKKSEGKGNELSGNNIGDSGVEMIGEALKSNSSLIKLDLGCDKKKRNK